MNEGIKLIFSLLLSVLGLLAAAMPIAVIPAMIARKKGHSWILWWLYGTFALFYSAVAFIIWWALNFQTDFGTIVLLVLPGIALFCLPFVHAYTAKPADTGDSYNPEVMFGQMVESREKRTSSDRLIYFLDTMGVWVTLVFIIVSLPLLYASLSPTEASQSATLIKAEAPPAAAAPPPPPSEAPKPQPKQVEQEIQGVQNVTEAPKEIVKAAPKPPAVPTFSSDDRGVVGGTGIPGGAGTGGVPGGTGIPGGTGTGDAPPPPPPPPPPPEEKKEPPKIIRKSGGVLAGEATSKPEPAYPPLAKAARVSGAVVVEVTIDENGSVISARALSGHPLLKDAATSAASRWRFKPTLLSGVPVKVIGTITFNFNL